MPCPFRGNPRRESIVNGDVGARKCPEAWPELILKLILLGCIAEGHWCPFIDISLYQAPSPAKAGRSLKVCIRYDASQCTTYNKCKYRKHPYYSFENTLANTLGFRRLDECVRSFIQIISSNQVGFLMLHHLLSSRMTISHKI